MNRLIIFVIGAVCGGGLAAGVYSSHVVQTNDKWMLVPRAGVSLTDMYADVRHWSLEDWRKHPELSRDMLKAGHAEVIKSAEADIESKLGEVIDETVNRISQRPEPMTHSSDRPAHKSQRRITEDTPSDFDPQYAP